MIDGLDKVRQYQALILMASWCALRFGELGALWCNSGRGDGPSWPFVTAPRYKHAAAGRDEQIAAALSKIALGS